MNYRHQKSLMGGRLNYKKKFYLRTEKKKQEMRLCGYIMLTSVKNVGYVAFEYKSEGKEYLVTITTDLVNEGSFKYVMGGSLPGLELKGIASAPVGYLSVLKIHPMDFEELMKAKNVSNVTLDMLKEKFVPWHTIEVVVDT